MNPADDLDEDAAARARRQAEDRETLFAWFASVAKAGTIPGTTRMTARNAPAASARGDPAPTRSSAGKPKTRSRRTGDGAEAATNGRITIPAPTNPQVHLLTWYIVNLRQMRGALVRGLRRRTRWSRRSPRSRRRDSGLADEGHH